VLVSKRKHAPDEEVVGVVLGPGGDVPPVALDGLSLRSAENHDADGRLDLKFANQESDAEVGADWVLYTPGEACVRMGMAGHGPCGHARTAVDHAPRAAIEGHCITCTRACRRPKFMLLAVGRRDRFALSVASNYMAQRASNLASHIKTPI
jgi:hypothetical protein